MRGCYTRAKELGLAEKEFAYFEALEVSFPSETMNVENLKLIAHDLLVSVKESSSVDWKLKESSRARMRRAIKRVLRKNECSEEQIDAALEAILRQAEING
jgi:type I restriction enzyme R subunit